MNLTEYQACNLSAVHFLSLKHDCGIVKNHPDQNLPAPSSGNRGIMKTPYDHDQVEEITLQPVQEYRNLWRERLAESVNSEGKQTSFDSRVRIIEKVDAWDIK